MKCPVCDVTLSISSREGVEIDFCPQCRGVWLDRGELDKILDRVVVAPPAPTAAPAAAAYQDRPRYDERRDDRGRDHDQGNPKRKKKKGFLEDMFDFG